MSNLLKKIEHKELFVTVYSKNRGKCCSQLSRELVNLARKGSVYQQQLDECATELRKYHGTGWTCCDESCRGHMYCKAYVAEVIE